MVGRASAGSAVNSKGEGAAPPRASAEGPQRTGTANKEAEADSLLVPKPYLGLCLDLPGKGRRLGAVGGAPAHLGAGISWKAAPLPHHWGTKGAGRFQEGAYVLPRR